MTTRIYSCGHTVGTPERIQAPCRACEQPAPSSGLYLARTLTAHAEHELSRQELTPVQKHVAAEIERTAVGFGLSALKGHAVAVAGICQSSISRHDEPSLEQVVADCRTRLLQAMAVQVVPADDDRARGLKMAAQEADYDVMVRMYRERWGNG
jgi:hypothetical protein